MIFSKILGEKGWDIRHFSTAEDALAEAAAPSRPAPALIFLDIRLPGMDGIEALERFMKGNPSLKIVMMTAYQTVESVIKAMKLGAADYLVKPLNPEMVLRAVEKYASGRAVAPEAGPRPARVTALRGEPDVFAALTEQMTGILGVAEKFAHTDGNVLILGESGTGKELLAHYIHQKSARAGKPFIVVDCASIPESLFESELFGYEKGAFTGAESPKAGRFELADGGTLFLDEIGNVPMPLQAKMLRFAEDRTLSRLGSKKTLAMDVRLISATNADLKKLVDKGHFREDLYYRVSALTLHLPPLRNRKTEEKEFLVRYFLKTHSEALNKPVPAIHQSAWDLIGKYIWPGNVRELENALYSAILICDTGALEAAHFPVGIQSYSKASEPSIESNDKSLRDILKKVEREQILSALNEAGGNKKKASETLDMDYKSFLNKLKEFLPEV
ncbi:MAG: hypothetical protein A2902_05080 [Elusimicrobia bacterium RIFCSPLOWO2_01_FULL_64_13]|nr:MAG: hypothetical protein A2902_05080 [Elusimicrobia bacterium RIFCSPLOWO2_01_FULL_64_13]